MRLISCPECARHVRVDARVCPFCDHALSPAPNARARVGALLVGAAAISTLAACGRMAVKYGAPPAPQPPEDTGTNIEAPAEPESPVEPSEPEEPEEPEAG